MSFIYDISDQFLYALERELIYFSLMYFEIKSLIL